MVRQSIYFAFVSSEVRILEEESMEHKDVSSDREGHAASVSHDSMYDGSLKTPVPAELLE